MLGAVSENQADMKGRGMTAGGRSMQPPGSGGFLGGLDSKELACCAGDPGLIPGSGRSPREGSGYPLQYSCLENSMARGAWQATVCGVAKSRTGLRDLTLSLSRVCISGLTCKITVAFQDISGYCLKNPLSAVNYCFCAKHYEW